MMPNVSSHKEFINEYSLRYDPVAKTFQGLYPDVIMHELLLVPCRVNETDLCLAPTG